MQLTAAHHFFMVETFLISEWWRKIPSRASRRQHSRWLQRCAARVSASLVSAQFPIMTVPKRELDDFERYLSPQYPRICGFLVYCQQVFRLGDRMSYSRTGYEEFTRKIQVSTCTRTVQLCSVSVKRPTAIQQYLGGASTQDDSAL